MEHRQIEIRVCDPQKIGEGTSAYVIYKVVKNVSCPEKKTFNVSRRFSDFHCLHGILSNRHLQQGTIVPPAPEKSFKEMMKVKVKISQDETVSSDTFIMKRRAALERYLNRIASHPVLRNDPDFRHFLETESYTHKETVISALSDTGIVRMFNEVGTTVRKLVFDKVNEPDKWFEERLSQMEDLEEKLKKWHSSIESVIHHRKELSQSVETFAKRAAELGDCEEHIALFRCFSQLADVEDKVEKLQCVEANHNWYKLSELLNDYINLIDVIKIVFNRRVQLYKSWENAESRVEDMLLSRPIDPSMQIACRRVLRDLEAEATFARKEFKTISKTIRNEVEMFERNMEQEFNWTIERCVEGSIGEQQEILNYWKSLLPEANGNI